MEFVKRGYVDLEELTDLNLIPPKQRVDKGPIAICECPQGIPCNPCETACPHKAIEIGALITNLPKVDWDKCIGCGICVTKCPGQAIFVVDGSRNIIGMPYEFIPLPEVEDCVDCLDRSGEIRCTGKIVSVMDKKSQDHTALVYVSVPKEFLMTIRGIKVVKYDV